jgi:putative transposase
VIVAALEIAPTVGVAFACRSLAMSRATFYRHRARRAEEDRASEDPNGPAHGERNAIGAELPSERSGEESSDRSGETSIEAASPASSVHRSTCRVPGRALSSAERQAVLDVLHADRFVDRSPAEVYATLLDEGTYLGSIRTFYRVLESEGESHERRRGQGRRNYAKPELLATRPKELWSWDITKLLGPFKWTYYYLYVLLDVFSRYVVGWTLDYRESETIAERLIEESCAKQSIAPGQLTLHADRGPSMTSKTVAELLINLGVAKTHSRPYTSNDNPYSEAQFKTLKYRPEFPDRFGSMAESLTFCRAFFPWYNTEHRHSGLALMTPEMVHYGRAEEIARERQNLLSAAYAQHPERFVGHPPVAALPPDRVWINPPMASKPSDPDLGRKEG